jgi:hypothetical protein
MHAETKKYNRAMAPSDRAIAQALSEEIDRALPEAENKVWHAHPVWFLEGNPIVGYSKLKDSVRLLFWSGQGFKEKGLKKEGTFKAAEARYTSVDDIDARRLGRWLAEARDVQWDYKNLVKRRGKLERLKVASRGSSAGLRPREAGSEPPGLRPRTSNEDGQRKLVPRT